ncbi:MAG TPA: response regulator [Terriglobales bacterium]|nr:response regulator [Terriglobales bacterium]
MNTPMMPALQPSGLIAARKKRVLLVDTSRIKRDLRSETMRKLGADVDCAADISEARSWWRPNLYDLVLIHGDTGKSQTDKFCDDMRRVMPAQQIKFLVGKPEYLSASPGLDEASSLPEEDAEAYAQMKAPPANDGPGDPSQRWGILEACRRISAVRHAADARSKAIRERPSPKRDPEVVRSTVDHREDLETLLTEFQERQQK